MKTLKIALVFISFFILRYYTGMSNVPKAGERVRLTIPIVDFAEYTDSKTIVRRGRWEVIIDGYTVVIPGDFIKVEGVWDGRKVLGESESVIVNHKFSNSLPAQAGQIDKLLIGISYVRRWAVSRLQRALPEPMASLASGILLGVKAQMPYDFYQQLVKTGTLHVIAASGFNVMIVASLLMAILGRVLARRWAIIGGIGGIAGYVLLAGASASVVRAGIMGSLTLIATYFGRVAEAKRLLWITAMIMLLEEPTMIGDIGFQLSMAATLGLLYIGQLVSSLKSQILKSTCAGRFSNWNLKWMDDLLIPTLVATFATAPVIWWHFGRLSLIGVFANMLILPVVPLIMLLSAINLIVQPVAYLLYVPLWWVVMVIRFFA